MSYQTALCEHLFQHQRSRSQYMRATMHFIMITVHIMWWYEVYKKAPDTTL